MIKVGVIRGGIGPKYEQSLATGATVLNHLRSDPMSAKYKAVDIFIDRDGLWHMSGRPTNMENVLNSTDVIFNALHGDFGEDGKLQQLLDQWNIPYVGSGAYASALSYNKEQAKERFDQLDIKTTRHILFPAYQQDFDGPIETYAQSKAKSVWERLPPPWIVKPLTRGSSMAIHVCKTFPELVRAFQVGVEEKVSVIVEEMVEGKHARVVVVPGFRGQDMYTFPAIEMRNSETITPGNFSYEEKKELERLAQLIHTGLYLDHYSVSDFVVHPKKGIFAVEVRTVPQLYQDSAIQRAFESTGATIPEFLTHVIEIARRA